MVRVSIAVQHHPSRGRLLARLLPGLGQDAEVVVDPEPDGPPSPWRCYKACLERTPGWATHRLVVQDDALVCRHFPAGCSKALQSRPGAVAAFYHGGYPHRSAVRLQRAAEAGDSWIRLLAEDWLPVVATAWPADLAQRFAACPDDFGRPNADDERAMHWLCANGLYALASIPSLAQHPDDQVSLVGGRARSKHRSAVCYIGEHDPTTSVDWSRGQD